MEKAQAVRQHLVNPEWVPTETPAEAEGSVAAAPGGWFECIVHRAGPAENGVIAIALSDVANSWAGWRWFYATSSIKKEMLATALTALSMQLQVSAALSSTDPDSTIERLYVQRS